MSFLQLLASDHYHELDPNDPRLWQGSGVYGRRTDSGMRVNPEISLGLAAYYASLRNISEDIAKLPFKVYRRDGRDKTVDREHPIYKLLNVQANPEMGAMTWRETKTQWAVGWGGGISEIERDNATRPVAFWPIHPSRVEIRRDRQTRKLWYIIKSDDAINTPDVKLPEEDVLHIHGLGGKGTTGYRLSMLAAQTIGIGLQTDRFAAKFFGNGITLSAVLTHPGTLSKEAKTAIREQWQGEYGGANDAHGLAVLAEDMKYERVGIPPNEAQFLESRQFTVQEIARWFRMPPHKIQDLEHATFSNIGEQNIEYVVDCLTSWAVRWEQEVNRKCFNAAGDTGLFAEHVFNMLLRGDTKSRGIFYRIMFMAGAMSQNDIRAAENLNAVEFGDTYYVPANMIPAEKAIEGPAPQPTQSRQPDGLNQSAVLPVAEDSLLRVLTKEARAAERASEKFLPGDRIAFEKWATEFYAGHAEYVAKEMLTTFKLMGILNRDIEHVSEQCESYAKAHCAASRLALARSSDVKKTVLDWLVTRAGTTGPILIESCSHADMGS